MRSARFIQAAASVLFLLLAMTTSTGVKAQTGSPANPLQITTTSLPDGIVGEPYEARLQATGGLPAYSWALDPQTKLPPGLTLGRNGMISGTANTPGEYNFTIQLRDEGAPGAWVQREFKITIRSAFAVVWRQEPVVQGNQIVGQVVVYNNVNDAVDLTVIVVAVNGVNKAFALRYEHFELGPKSETKAIQFGSSVPNGNYIVHVDAVGEVAASNKIFRSRQQTAKALSVISR